MLIVTLKQIEAALAAGRLDEAYQRVQSADVREHQRGQELLGQVASALAARGREHLEASRLDEAGADADKAARLAGNQAEVAALHGEVMAALGRQRQRLLEQEEALAQARRRVMAGQLSTGEALAAGAGGDQGPAAGVLGEAAQRRREAAQAMDQAERALEQGDFGRAASALTAARGQHGSSERLAELTERLCAQSAVFVRAEMTAGRLDRASAVLGALGELGQGRFELEELGRALRQCGQALAAIRRGDGRAASESLRRAEAMVGRAAWLREALGQAEQLAASLDGLQAGPLGLLGAMSGAGAAENSPAAGGAEQEAERGDRLEPGRAAGAAGEVMMEARQERPGRRLMLQVDGVGSYAVVTGRRVTVGSVSASRACDVGLIAEPSLPVATIERVEEDYFLRGPGRVEVNGKALTSTLLDDGDRLALSRRCRLMFRRPNAASGTALLALSSARFPRPDVRAVVLMDREIIIGPGPGAHVRVDDLENPVILYVQDGRWRCRVQGAAGEGESVALEKSVRMGGLSFVLTRWT